MSKGHLWITSKRAGVVAESRQGLTNRIHAHRRSRLAPGKVEAKGYWSADLSP
jgi:hypothetical protein